MHLYRSAHSFSKHSVSVELVIHIRSESLFSFTFPISGLNFPSEKVAFILQHIKEKHRDIPQSLIFSPLSEILSFSLPSVVFLPNLTPFLQDS